MLSPDDRMLLQWVAGMGVGQLALLVQVVVSNSSLKQQIKDALRRIENLEERNK